MGIVERPMITGVHVWSLKLVLFCSFLAMADRLAVYETLNPSTRVVLVVRESLRTKNASVNHK